MTNNSRLEHTSAAHWVKAITEALGSIKRLEQQQTNIAENTREIMVERQQELGQYIEKARWGEKATSEEIERTSRQMAEYQQDIDRHQLLAAAYAAAAAILEAATEEYHYAARPGYYETRLAKFQTAEARDAFLEDNGDWRAATEEDLQKIFWGAAIPTDGAPRE